MPSNSEYNSRDVDSRLRMKVYIPYKGDTSRAIFNSCVAYWLLLGIDQGLKLDNAHLTKKGHFYHAHYVTSCVHSCAIGATNMASLQCSCLSCNLESMHEGTQCLGCHCHCNKSSFSLVSGHMPCALLDKRTFSLQGQLINALRLQMSF